MDKAAASDIIVGDKMRIRLGVVKAIQGLPGMTSLLVKVRDIIQEEDDTKTIIVDQVNL